MECMSIIGSYRPGSGVAPAHPETPYNGFYGPAQLRSAYKLTAASARDGQGRTIAIVDAFSDPKAAPDLARYRSHFHLRPCTTASGCLRIVDEQGQARPLPRPMVDWADEESLDLDMVSAICPRCHILLVEATNNQDTSLSLAEQTAVTMGARYVSNSWAGAEFYGQESFAHYFDHPGVVIAFASGDYGYGAAFPTDLQYVTAVGGTSLRHAAGQRGWNETVWGARALGAEGTGSGCSALQPKPSWQRMDASSPGGCMNRTENDVAAVANPGTGVAVYDTYSPDVPAGSGWAEYGGTSVATPIITAVYALAGLPAPRTYPSEYPYLHKTALFNVPAGVNGMCEPYRYYLCHGGSGYNGPTGLGTPDGTAAFAGGSARRVTVLDPGTQDQTAGSRFSLRVTGLDTATRAAIRWQGRDLPAGLSIRAVPGSTGALIAGELPATPGSWRVTITATDGVAAGFTHFSIVTVPSMRASDLLPGPLILTARGLCADAGSGASGTSVRVLPCDNGSGQGWSFQGSGEPGATGALVAAGHCLTAAAGRAVLASCDGSPSVSWRFDGLGALQNVATGTCLAVPSLHRGTRLTVTSCDIALRPRYESWKLPPGPILSAVGGCLDNPGNRFSLGINATVAACDGTTAQQWSLSSTASIRSASTGFCLDGSGSTSTTDAQVLDGAAVVLNFCAPSVDANEVWLPGPGGQLVSARSGKCLAIRRADGRTALALEDCYGSRDEVWGVN
jgi:Ricin-type beta-trefoil lectin domain/Subtilase family